MAKLSIRKGDQVEVLSGKDRGKREEVIRTFPSEGKVMVCGVAVVKKAQRPDQFNQQGGIIEKEMPIDASNVALVCPSCGKAGRVGHVSEDGRKLRVCKKCGNKF